MRQIFTTLIVCALFATTGCSVLISTPPVARIQMYGLNNQLNEYIVDLDSKPSENMIDIPITDRYAINLDFQWLLGEEEFNAESEEGVLIQDLPITPWMMCTYRF